MCESLMVELASLLQESASSQTIATSYHSAAVIIERNRQKERVVFGLKGMIRFFGLWLYILSVAMQKRPRESFGLW